MPFPPKKLIGSTPFGNHKLMDWGVFDHKDEEKGDWKVASWAVDQLNAKPKEPFFMSVGFFLPHVPCFATQKWFDLYPDDNSVLPKILKNDRADTPRFSWYMHWYLPEVRHKWLEENNQWRNLVRSYLACTSFVDNQVGRLINALNRNNFDKNTIIVLWSDHGWHLGEKGISGKNTLWDDGTRVPLIFAGPGIKPKRGRGFRALGGFVTSNHPYLILRLVLKTSSRARQRFLIPKTSSPPLPPNPAHAGPGVQPKRGRGFHTLKGLAPYIILQPVLETSTRTRSIARLPPGPRAGTWRSL